MQPRFAIARVPMQAQDEVRATDVPVGTRGSVQVAYFEQATGTTFYLLSWPMGLTVLPSALLFEECEVICEEVFVFTVNRGNRLQQTLRGIARRQARSAAAQRGWATRRAKTVIDKPSTMLVFWQA